MRQLNVPNDQPTGVREEEGGQCSSAIVVVMYHVPLREISVLQSKPPPTGGER